MPPLGARRINRKKSTQFVVQRTGNRGEMAGFGSLNRLGLGHATGIRRAQRLALMARPTGIEPVSRASETLILSIELRAQRKEAVLYPVFAELHEQDQIFRQTHRKPGQLHWTGVYDTVI